MEWVFILIVSGSSASQSVARVTEPQCRAMIATYERHSDPLMAYCFGPSGETVMTTDVPTRVARERRPTRP